MKGAEYKNKYLILDTPLLGQPVQTLYLLQSGFVDPVALLAERLLLPSA